jgi:hypothetical protein
VRVLQQEFWSGFSEYLDEENSSFNSRKARAQNWYSLSIGTSLAYISLTILVSTNGRIGCELYLPGRKQANLIFEALKKEQAAVESELEGLGELEWQDLPDKKACRIVIYRSGVNLEDPGQWPDLYGWLRERCERFKATFAPRLQSMDLPDPDTTVIASAAAAEASATEPTTTVE